MIRILKFVKCDSYIRQLVCTKHQLCRKHTDGDTSNNLLQLLRDMGELKYRKIVCLVGAGLSTASGIPDFRTPGSGIYDNLQKYNLPYPEAIFELDYFLQNPTPFYQFCREIYPGKYKPCLAHYFLKFLQDKGILLRVYTQNIDGLELQSGLSPESVVGAHGGFSSASCSSCGHPHDQEIVKNRILEEQLPILCQQKLCNGFVKPDIVMFGENLPSRFFTLQSDDFNECDLLLVTGTSLVVQPFGSLVNSPSDHVPRVLLNREVVYPFSYVKKDRKSDHILEGDIVQGVRRLMLAAGWRRELIELSNDEMLKL